MARGKIIPLCIRSEGPKQSIDEDILDHGSIGDLHYEINHRQVIHISDKKGHFKKDADSFEEALNKLDLESLQEGESLTITGSGDNDDLVFTMKEGDLKLSLAKKGFGVVEKLRGLISKSRKKGVA